MVPALPFTTSVVLAGVASNDGMPVVVWLIVMVLLTGLTVERLYCAGPATRLEVTVTVDGSEAVIFTVLVTEPPAAGAMVQSRLVLLPAVVGEHPAGAAPWNSPPPVSTMRTTAPVA